MHLCCSKQESAQSSLPMHHCYVLSKKGCSVIELTSGISSTSEPPSLSLKGTCNWHSENIWKFKMLANDTVYSQKVSTPEPIVFHLSSCHLVSSSTSW